MRRRLIGLATLALAGCSFSPQQRAATLCNASWPTPDRRIAACDQLLATKSSNLIKSIVYYDRASANVDKAYARKASYDAAIADYTAAVTFSPGFAWAYDNRGSTYTLKGDFDHAIADYTKAIAVKPDDASAYYNRGLSYAGKGLYDQAIADFTKSDAIKPLPADDSVALGATRASKGALDQAIADYTRAIAAKPDYALAYYDRGNAYALKGALDPAIADLTKAISLRPNYTSAYNSRGGVYLRKGQNPLAAADFARAKALRPDYAGAYEHHGWVYYHADLSINRPGYSMATGTSMGPAIAILLDFILAFVVIWKAFEVGRKIRQIKKDVSIPPADPHQKSYVMNKTNAASSTILFAGLSFLPLSKVLELLFSGLAISPGLGGAIAIALALVVSFLLIDRSLSQLKEL